MQECLLNETTDNAYSATLSCEKAVERERGIQQLTNEYNRTSEYSFVIVGSNRGIDQDKEGIYGRSTMLDGKETFKRIFIKRV